MKLALTLAFLLFMGTIPSIANARTIASDTEGSKMTDETSNVAAVKVAFQAWQNGTGSPYDLLAADAVWTIVGHSDASRRYGSRQAFIDEVIRPFNERMREPLKPSIRSITAQGDRVVIFFDAAGVARDGKPYENTYSWIWTMRDGKVVEAYAFFDSIAFNDLWRRVSPSK